jgi:hypothetical protein
MRLENFGIHCVSLPRGLGLVFFPAVGPDLTIDSDMEGESFL